jgi:hypothetical protein
MTVKQLFGLHLTIRHPTPQINNALDWLLTQVKRQLDSDDGRRREFVQRQMTEQLPFMAGRRDGFVLGATLFLASSRPPGWFCIGCHPFSGEHLWPGKSPANPNPVSNAK